MFFFKTIYYLRSILIRTIRYPISKFSSMLTCTFDRVVRINSPQCKKGHSKATKKLFVNVSVTETF